MKTVIDFSDKYLFKDCNRVYFKTKAYDGKGRPVIEVKGLLSVWLASWRVTDYKLSYVGTIRYDKESETYGFFPKESIKRISMPSMLQVGVKLKELNESEKK